ncbi:MAG TPA: MgtC/SapB family protein [Chthonomonadales bacterium]|nr:MgtC/SapB family protein [Chthonomonadales bacterium]
MLHPVAPEVVPAALALGLSIILGGLIGLERELHGHPAGLRTHILVCLGSTLLTLTSISVAASFGGDPGRIAAQIVAGIGFIGAGAIIRDRASIKGLTTAASIWTTSAIGIAVGSGAAGVWMAVLTAVAALLTLWALHAASRWADRRSGSAARIEVVLDGTQTSPATVLAALESRSVAVSDFRADRSEGRRERTIRLSLGLPSGMSISDLAQALSALDGVRSLRIH